MSLALLAVKPDDIKSFVARNGTTYASNNATEVWAAFLAGNGGTGTGLKELEETWLASSGAVGNNLTDLWGSYLKAQGYSGSIQHMIQQLFSSGTFSESILDNLLLEDGYELALESSAQDALVLE